MIVNVCEGRDGVRDVVIVNVHCGVEGVTDGAIDTMCYMV